jgi:hypothetical protein
VPGLTDLQAIDNAAGAGSYLVTWARVANADSCTSQKDDNHSFLHPVIASAEPDYQRRPIR